MVFEIPARSSPTSLRFSYTLFFFPPHLPFISFIMRLEECVGSLAPTQCMSENTPHLLAIISFHPDLAGEGYLAFFCGGGLVFHAILPMRNPAFPISLIVTTLRGSLKTSLSNVRISFDQLPPSSSNSVVLRGLTQDFFFRLCSHLTTSLNAFYDLPLVSFPPRTPRSDLYSFSYHTLRRGDYLFPMTREPFPSARKTSVSCSFELRGHVETPRRVPTLLTLLLYSAT